MGLTLAQGRAAPSPSVSSKTLDLWPRKRYAPTSEDLYSQDVPFALSGKYKDTAMGVVKDRVRQGLIHPY